MTRDFPISGHFAFKKVSFRRSFGFWGVNNPGQMPAQLGTVVAKFTCLTMIRDNIRRKPAVPPIVQWFKTRMDGLIAAWDGVTGVLEASLRKKPSA